MEEKILEYAPIIICVVIFLIQQHILISPEQLERKHRQILEDIERKYVTWSSFKDLKAQFSDVHNKVDKIYEVIIKGRE